MSRVDLLNAFGNSGRILFFCLLLLSSLPLSAATLTESLAVAERNNLAQDPTWLRLLHFERGMEMSTVLTDSFFLAPDGRHDPRAELEATLSAYFDPVEGTNDASARCRFPARYYWLSHQLELPGYELRVAGCEKLENWALFDLTKSISLLLVSGYLGNPASTFGHALIKLNTDSVDDKAGLFDLTLNFGALVPPNENPLFYVARGLTGSYRAGFSDKYFYTQDLVYSRTEFRDMWDYRLDLTEYQRTLMILHIWEIVGKKFKYYFLDKNCAYRLAELLELVIAEDLLDDAGAWYIPVDLFHRLQEIDKDRQEAGRPRLVASSRYIPSSRRKLYHVLKGLSDDEMDTLNEVLEQGTDSLEGHLEGFSADQKIAVLDGLLAYQQYRLVADRPDSTSNARQEKDQVLLARLRQPARSYVAPTIAEMRSPADGLRPMALSVGAGYEPAGPNFGRLSWSPFKKESVGQNSLEGNELVLLDLSVGVADDSPAVFLDQLDVIRILSLNTLRSRIRGEGGLSWKLRVGVDRFRAGQGNDYDGVFSFGAGRGWQWSKAFSGFCLLNAEGHTNTTLVRAFPEVGLLISLANFRAQVGYGVATTDYEGGMDYRWGAKGLYRLSERHAVHVEHRERRDVPVAVTTVGLTRYF